MPKHTKGQELGLHRANFSIVKLKGIYLPQVVLMPQHQSDHQDLTDNKIGELKSSGSYFGGIQKSKR